MRNGNEITQMAKFHIKNVSKWWTFGIGIHR
ncbi:hypothetical protein EM595_p0079 (plasmid) [Duffyella gerundensis]|uniref:Uncharacterized protein n=1 Tax=Duffyella gerundensis TaxID=1619313 RepID=A0A0U5LAP7_9GAMM|nr:hypothetical protein EM595_p0079 [Duffyella gerundensis]